MGSTMAVLTASSRESPLISALINGVTGSRGESSSSLHEGDDPGDCASSYNVVFGKERSLVADSMWWSSNRTTRLEATCGWDGLEPEPVAMLRSVPGEFEIILDARRVMSCTKCFPSCLALLAMIGCTFFESNDLRFTLSNISGVMSRRSVNCIRRHSLHVTRSPSLVFRVISWYRSSLLQNRRVFPSSSARLISQIPMRSSIIVS
mmetsp:Transcript_35504/g.68069  ORF Transcript_35504/g.68069 Transcript_35504/m.68069 type:complete len:206 (+) Transcript_35504:1830-2447(+)